MNLLHIDASILGDHSASRQVTAAIVKRLADSDPDLKVTYRDLGAQPLAHYTAEHFAAVPNALTAHPALDEGHAALDEFLAADVVVIGAPMYNFTIPSQLKAWIDRIIVAGKTFRYSPNGVEGLAAGKRVIVALSRGNFYSPGAPAAAFEHAESYLRTVFAFIGVTNLEFVTAEGLQVSPDHRQRGLAAALEAVAALAPALQPA